MTTFQGYAATSAGSELKPFEFDVGELKGEQVEIAVEYCGICHSDLSMLDNEWGFSKYPFVPGHEVVGKVVAAGEHVRNVKVGDTVGLGWFSGSCMACHQCLSGNHNLCTDPTGNEQTIIGRHGGFANRIRCHWVWATPIPAALDAAKAGPLFCGGVTVFNPIVQFGVSPTSRVGVIGIGGLGHAWRQFLNKWGCEVIAFTSYERVQSRRGKEARSNSCRQFARQQPTGGDCRQPGFHSLHSECHAGLAGVPQLFGSQGPVPYGRSHCRADFGRRIPADCRAEINLGLAPRQPDDHSTHDRILRSS